MKYALIALLLFIGSSVTAVELPEHLLQLKKSLRNDIKIGSVTRNTIRNDEREKIERLKFHTYQDEQDDLNYRIRITLELTSKTTGEAYFAQFACKQPSLPLEYTGQTTWEFQIPHGEVEKAKLTAYAIQYGFLEDGFFVPVAEKFDDVDSVEEITGRTTDRLEGLSLVDWVHTYRE